MGAKKLILREKNLMSAGGDGSWCFVASKHGKPMIGSLTLPQMPMVALEKSTVTMLASQTEGSSESNGAGGGNE